MHATGQVQPQLHRASTQVTQPIRRGLRQVQRNHEVLAQRFAHNILGRQLIFLLHQTQQATPALLGQAQRLDFDASFAQCTTGTLQIGLLDLHGRAVAADLDRRIVWIEVWRGIEKADHQYNQDQQVLPYREFIEHDAARYDAGRLKRPVEW
ncbi:hypothetical protein FQZ97_989220 [compost metagenome]